MVSQAVYADLEIRILPRETQGYPVEITLNREQEFPRGYLDPAFLPWVPTASPAADGERLFQWLLGHVGLRTAWAEARGLWPQRFIRLRIDTKAPKRPACCENCYQIQDMVFRRTWRQPGLPPLALFFRQMKVRWPSTTALWGSYFKLDT